MEDRFQFKVYYKPHKKIYNVICLNSLRQEEIIIEYKGGSAVVEWNNCVILQSTGLKDKSDKPIHEGDIVYIAEEDEIADIKWDKERAKFEIHLINENVALDFDNYRGEDLEIVDDIYNYMECSW